MLTRTSFGFSPVMFLFYTVVLLLLFCMALRLRRPFGLALRRLRRTSWKRNVDNAYLMEEGSLQTTPSSILPPSLLHPPPPYSSRLSRPRTPLLNTTSHVARPALRHAHSPPASPPTTIRILPTLSQYEPAYSPIGTSTASQYHSRTSSPTLGSALVPMVRRWCNVGGAFEERVGDGFDGVADETVVDAICEQGVAGAVEWVSSCVTGDR